MVKKNLIVLIMNINKEIWIGLLHVQTKNQIDELLGSCSGAYVTVLCKAKSKESFISIIKEYVDELGWIFCDLDEIEQLIERCKHYSVDRKVVRLSKALKDYGHVRFGTFHTY